MKLSLAALIYGTGTVLFFNAGMWQLYRRKWKQRLIDLQRNLDGGEITQIPPPGNPVPQLYQKVSLEGSFDYTGSVLVGPRGCPDLIEGKAGLPAQMLSTTGSKKWGESQSGFYVFTPFRVAADKSVLIVNLGWVPIDSCRSEPQFRKYLRKTTNAIQRLKGHVCYEEDFATWWNGYTQGYHKKVGASWPVIRPAEICDSYNENIRKKAEKQLTETENDMFLEPSTPTTPATAGTTPAVQAPSTHPPRHYYVSMYDEDDTGRVVIDGEIFPKRQSALHRRTHTIAPNTHLQYAVFWFACSAMSARFLKRSVDHVLKLSRQAAAEAKLAERLKQREGPKNAVKRS